LLGILLHAGLAYLAYPGLGWAVQDPSTHWSFGAAILVVHSFRLELFFLLAGFFARLLYQRRGPSGFTLNRLVRVVVPFVAGWFLVFPGLAFAWIWGASKGDPAAVGTALQQAIGAAFLPILWLLQGNIFKTGFPLTHLWFLYYLLLVYALFLSLRAAGRAMIRPGNQWPHRLDSALRRLFESGWAVIPLGILTWVLLLGMKSWTVDTPDKSFLPQAPTLLLYGLFFSLGWFLHRHADLLEGFTRRWGRHVLFATAASVIVLALSGFEGKKEHLYWGQIRGAYFLAYAFMMWSWVLAFLGFFVRYLPQESRVWRYLSDSSYWLYIVHLPIVVVLQVAFYRWPIACGVKFLLVIGLTLSLCLLSYHFLVRSTPIGQILNGRRYPFHWFPTQRGRHRSEGALP
jgi:peptidoglycan/LPS O-acetylase OafA/YrhL